MCVGWQTPHIVIESLGPIGEHWWLIKKEKAPTSKEYFFIRRWLGNVVWRMHSRLQQLDESELLKRERERLHVVTCSDLLTLKAYTCWRWADDEDADLLDFIKMKLIKLIYCVPFRNFSFHILKVISLLEPSWWFEQSNIKYQAKPLRHFWKEDWDRWSTDYPKIWVVCFSWKLSQFKVIFLWISRSWFTFSTLLTFARPWLHLWI